MTQLHEDIRASLNENGFENEAIDKFIETYNSANAELKKETPKVKSRNVSLMGAIERFLNQNPDLIKNLTPRPHYKLVYQAFMATAILTTILILAHIGILGTCETATILGGAVGYLVGNKS